MQIRYVFKEGFSGFKRAKLSMFAAIFTICISLLLLSSFTILLLNAERAIQELRGKVEVEAFLEEHLTADEVENLRGQISGMEGVESVRFISKEEAAEIFKQNFGEDIFKVLDFNPLPRSFKIFLKQTHRTTQEVTRLFESVRSLQGVEKVIYSKDLLDMIDQQGMTLLWFMLGLGSFVMVSAIILVANTIRLAIYAKRKIIQSMKLIGATRSFIRTPFLLEGSVQGMVGGLIAAAVVFVVFNYLERWVSAIQLSHLVTVEVYYYATIVGVGCALGLFGSMISIRRFIGESVAT